ncbi:hypothetical protein BVRB_033220, partial [Beta vulgaris subsp. vulgaris]
PPSNKDRWLQYPDMMDQHVPETSPDSEQPETASSSLDPTPCVVNQSSESESSVGAVNGDNQKSSEQIVSNLDHNKPIPAKSQPQSGTFEELFQPTIHGI